MLSTCPPSGASVRSVRLGMETSRLGSLIGRPVTVSSSNTCSQAAPKVMVWWAWPAISSRTPTWMATQLGE